MGNDLSGEPILRIYWEDAGDDTKAPRKQADVWWGQLAGGAHRLVAIQEEFGALCRLRDVEKSLRRLELYLEVFLARAYELGERARGLLASLTCEAESVKKFRKRLWRPELRAEALSRLHATRPQLATALKILIEFLDQDRELRNEHTHQHYVSLGLGAGIYNPYDVLLEFSGQPSKARRLRRLLRQGIRQIAGEYQGKIEILLRLIHRVLDGFTPMAS